MDRFSFQPALHGSGGFGKVIKGRDNTLERDIAIKVLDPLTTQFNEADSIGISPDDTCELRKVSHRLDQTALKTGSQGQYGAKDFFKPIGQSLSGSDFAACHSGSEAILDFRFKILD